MTAGGEGKCGGEVARGRLALYVRYAELVKAQEAALAAEDLEAFAALAGELEEIRGSVGGAGRPRLEPADDAEAGGPELLEEASSILRSTLARTQRIQARLSALRRAQGDQIRTLKGRAPQARRYTAADGDSAGRSKLDLTF